MSGEVDMNVEEIEGVGTVYVEEVNTARKLVGRLPTEPEVVQWIAAAKSMPKVVEH